MSVLHGVVYCRDKEKIVENAQFTQSLALRAPAFEAIFNADTVKKIHRAKASTYLTNEFISKIGNKIPITISITIIPMARMITGSKIPTI